MTSTARTGATTFSNNSGDTVMYRNLHHRLAIACFYRPLIPVYVHKCHPACVIQFSTHSGFFIVECLLGIRDADGLEDVLVHALKDPICIRAHDPAAECLYIG